MRWQPWHLGPGQGGAPPGLRHPLRIYHHSFGLSQGPKSRDVVWAGIISIHKPLWITSLCILGSACLQLA